MPSMLLLLLFTFFAACHHRSSKSRMRSGDTLLASSLQRGIQCVQHSSTNQCCTVQEQSEEKLG
jgi:hypothetical protein